MSERPPAWAVFGTFGAALAFIGLVLVYLPWTLSRWQLAPPLLGLTPLRWVGAVLAAFAIPVLADFLVRFVREGHGTPMVLAPPRRLVRGGVFRWVRNPGYLAADAMLFGQGLLFGSTLVLGYALGLALAFHLFVVLVEEPALRRTFGAAYLDYCREVPRWIPRGPKSADHKRNAGP